MTGARVGRATDDGPGTTVLLLGAAVAGSVAAVTGAFVSGVASDTRLDRLLGPPVIALAAPHRRSVVALAELGGPATAGLVVAVLAATLLVRGRWSDALLVVLAPVVAGLLTQLVLKPLVDRPLGGEPAYPSGHASGTWALATVVVLLVARSAASTRTRLADSAAVVAVALVSSTALVGAQYHFATDVTGGACVGVCVACLLAVVLGGVAGAGRRG